MTRSDRIKALKAAAKERVLILDGSWGVMFQKRGLSEADYRGERFKDHPGQM
jgi:5-methyltetrahydrofolate--homocysteine methyltransferase